MNRSWIIWATSIVCMVIVLGAVGMVTHITLTLEEKIYVEDEKNLQVEKSIVAMEAYVDALFARENARDAEEFVPVQSSVVKGGKGNKDVQIENRINPLFSNAPENVNYYWYNSAELEGETINASSPQLPTWGELENFYPNDEEKGKLEKSIQLNQRLNVILNCTPSVAHGNVAVLEELNRNVSEQKVAVPYDDVNNAILVQQLTEYAHTVSDNTDLVQDKVIEELKKTKPISNSTWSGLRKETQQQRNNRAALEKEQRFYSRADNSKNPFFTKSKTKEDLTPERQNLQPRKASYLKVEEVSEPESREPIVDNKYLGSFVNAEVSPFVALLLQEELMLVRHVKSDSGASTQGVWLNKEKIEEDLLTTVRVFLPNANLEVVKEGIDLRTLSYSLKNAYGLSRLPYQLIPGELPVNVGGITPMRLNLIVACTCILLAIFAVLIMFRGVMKLSERRASFVSSVSHELRTPLTTFKLYSEMLAEGMVKDKDKQQEYLQTLSKESDRLSHMVENVLSFSQLERGNVKRELSEVKMKDLLFQIDGRMRACLEEEGIDFENTLTDELMEVSVKVDPTSVDQILTNLLDNAIKYGQPEKGKGKVELKGEVKADHIKLLFSDNGPGVAGGSKKIFKAFHKSDVEAANSKPGVGLGLALSRELAKSMEGDLILVDSSIGAYFELRLSKA